MGCAARDPGDALTRPTFLSDCHPDSARERGWRQGCQLTLDLPLEHVTVRDNRPYAVRDVHGHWLVAEQDCDLAHRALVGSSYTLELRAVWHDDAPRDWGIRNTRFLLDASGAYLNAEVPVVRVTPDVLDLAKHLTCPHPPSGQRLKTWLGLRYDRPAIPEAYAKLAGKLAERLKRKSRRELGERLRDVLATFRTVEGESEYTLIAVLPHSTATPELLDRVRQWLAEVALEVPETLGRPVNIEARTDRQVSLAFLEESYGLAVSTLSWPVNEPGPIGAV